MNRRQEIALWVVGCIAATVSGVEGQENGDWFFTYLVPVLIVGALLLFSLRTRTATTGVNKATAAKILLLVLLFGYVRHRLSFIEDSIGEAASGARELQAAIYEVKSETEDTKAAVSDVELKVDEIVDDLESMRP